MVLRNADDSNNRARPRKTRDIPSNVETFFGVAECRSGDTSDRLTFPHVERVSYVEKVSPFFPGEEERSTMNPSCERRTFSLKKRPMRAT